MENIAYLVPAYKPTTKLTEIVHSIRRLSSAPIVVVNDGSGDLFYDIFSSCAEIPDCIVISNAVNLGKGAALKLGINWILTKIGPRGIVTFDADGQHTIEDIIAVSRELASNPESLVLGARSFGTDVPFRSKFGNNVSRFAYRALLGLALRDTQTGLRGLPLALSQNSLHLRSNRYEFETEQLALVSSLSIPVREISIRTVYEDNNASSHFNPLFDSARIYFVVLRYAFSSIATSVVDFISFLLFLPIIHSIIATNLFSRAVAVTLQFILLRNFVFKTDGGLLKFFIFVIYVTITGLVSGVLQQNMVDASISGPFFAKILVETGIFIFNFLFLRDIMFRVSR